jgi:hypothetical protein
MANYCLATVHGPEIGFGSALRDTLEKKVTMYIHRR